MVDNGQGKKTCDVSPTTTPYKRLPLIASFKFVFYMEGAFRKTSWSCFPKLRKYVILKPNYFLSMFRYIGMIDAQTGYIAVTMLVFRTTPVRSCNQFLSQIIFIEVLKYWNDRPQTGYFSGVMHYCYLYLNSKWAMHILLNNRFFEHILCKISISIHLVTAFVFESYVCSMVHMEYSDYTNKHTPIVDWQHTNIFGSLFPRSAIYMMFFR